MQINQEVRQIIVCLLIIGILSVGAGYFLFT